MFFITKNYLFKYVGKLSEKKDCVDQFAKFLTKFKNKIIKKNINPFELVFHSRLPLEVSNEDFLKIVEMTFVFMKENNLQFSIYDTEDFFRFGGSFHVNKEFIKTIQNNGYNLDNLFINNILESLQHLEITSQKKSLKWNFAQFIKILNESNVSFELNENNLAYYNKMNL